MKSLGRSLAMGLWLALCAGMSAHGATIEGVKLDERVYIAQGLPELVLNGAGVRRKLVLAKIYVAGLYLTTRRANAAEVVSDTGPKRVAMHILVDEITAEEFVAALNDGLAANLAPAELAPLEARLRELAQMMRAVGRLARGGTVVLDYLPGIGTRVSINGTARLTVPGEDFNRALLRVWLGDRPVDGRLKSALLGGSGGLLPF